MAMRRSDQTRCLGPNQRVVADAAEQSVGSALTLQVVVAIFPVEVVVAVVLRAQEPCGSWAHRPSIAPQRIVTDTAKQIVAASSTDQRVGTVAAVQVVGAVDVGRRGGGVGLVAVERVIVGSPTEDPRISSASVAQTVSRSVVVDVRSHSSYVTNI